MIRKCYWNLNSKGTLHSYKQLDADVPFGELFADERPNHPEADKTGDEKEIESMVTVTIEQDTSAIPSLAIPTPTVATTTAIPTTAATTTTTTTTTTRAPTPPVTLECLVSRVVSLETHRTDAELVHQDINKKLEEHKNVLRDIQKLELH